MCQRRSELCLEFLEVVLLVEQSAAQVVHHQNFRLQRPAMAPVILADAARFFFVGSKGIWPRRSQKWNLFEAGGSGLKQRFCLVR